MNQLYEIDEETCLQNVVGISALVFKQIREGRPPHIHTPVRGYLYGTSPVYRKLTVLYRV